MKKGDRVKLIGIPPDVRDDEKLETKTLFEKCVGKIFPIEEIESVEGRDQPLIKLDVGQVLGKAAYMETIWVEPEYLEPCDSK